MTTVIKYKPTSPSRRHMVNSVGRNLYKGNPFRRLTKKISKTGGRNNLGRITTRHIGGGHKRKYRVIDFKRNKDNIGALVKRIEYDPNRTSNIALIMFKDGERRYIIAPKGLGVGDLLKSGKDVKIKIGNCLPIENIPVGCSVHNVELKKGRGGQLARSAGNYAQIISKENDFAVIRLRSGEIRKIRFGCRATVGEVGNGQHMLQHFGKAGKSRWKGIRPTVRGTAMNPIDHPHGGGEGRNFGKHPVTPWGMQTKGKKTRKNKRTERDIIHHRSK
ncbi:50S ribosomal protein L2 [Candidatus Riesia pediculischaeffi]|uniref:Large ribosomal subunit protein uL2 n=1 Tax=Candidatus Riesia pediculischaeffi TaxID=428411 RepID=A0A1V0HKZ7_9ENTR|nr:50S ribosomal protein L2 [Candidatus Riesia pediculischaeffi]ARC53510.1 50S ribosomal protein L2 [Candidatus Riesia pediculischaeffi]